MSNVQTGDMAKDIRDGQIVEVGPRVDGMLLLLMKHAEAGAWRCRCATPGTYVRDDGDRVHFECGEWAIIPDQFLRKLDGPETNETTETQQEIQA